jgi:hypothetical protein
MKKQMRSFSAALLVLCGLLIGCVPSLNPLYTAETTVFRDDLVGVWKENSQDEEGWTFAKAEDKSYTVTIQEKEDSSKFEGRLVKLDDSLFLDLFPAGDAFTGTKIGDFYKASLVPGHLILKIKIGPQLELQMLEPGRLAEHLKNNPKSLAHVFSEKERLVITASTEDLQKFFKQHAKNAAFWNESSSNLKKLAL